MGIDVRKLEHELARIFRGHGVNTCNYHGDEFAGIASVEPSEAAGPIVPAMPRTEVISLATLAKDIAEALS